jgi:hypothetical protein
MPSPANFAIAFAIAAVACLGVSLLLGLYLNASERNSEIGTPVYARKKVDCKRKVPAYRPVEKRGVFCSLVHHTHKRAFSISENRYKEYCNCCGTIWPELQSCA